MSTEINCIPYLLVSTIKPNPIETNELETETENEYKGENSAFLDSQNFQTTFVDKSTLIKTLEDFNVQNLSEKRGISCTYKDFVLNFHKRDTDKTYFLSVKFYNKIELNKLLEDLSELYLLKSQETTYNNLLKYLKEQNIEYREEILDNDTAVFSFDLNNQKTHLKITLLTNALVKLELDGLKNKKCLEYIELLKNTLHIKLLKE